MGIHVRLAGYRRYPSTLDECEEKIKLVSLLDAVTLLANVFWFVVKSWSRREEFNAPSADYNSAALALSYTGLRNFLYHTVRARSPTEIID